MRPTLKSLAVLAAVFGVALQIGAQGFVNLNFESANVSGYGTSSPYVPTNQAIPGWTAYSPSATYGPQEAARIGYNEISIGGAAISIFDTNIGFAPIQDRYSILFQGQYVPGLPPGSDFGSAAEIAQTGVISNTIQSLIFWGNLQGVELLFNGQNIPYSVIGSGANYNIYQADISGFAGQTVTMGFLALVNGGGTLDNIQFSTTAAPEPTSLSLTALGALLLGCRRWESRCFIARRNRRPPWRRRRGS